MLAPHFLALITSEWGENLEKLFVTVAMLTIHKEFVGM
jgi:hypothetical protein